MTIILTAAGLMALVAVAALLLRRAWAAPSAQRPWLILAGWGLGAAVIVVAAWPLGPVRGPVAALMLGSVAVLGVILSGIEIRTSKRKADRELALEPSDRPSRAWRGWMRGLLAGPLAGVAAMGVGLAITLFLPGVQQTRMMLGGLMVPLLWAGGMAWTLSDDRILRATAVLSTVAVVSLGASFLKGTLG